MDERKASGTVLAAVLHELLKVESFTTLTDLAEATKCRAAKLRIPYDSARVDAALVSVGRTRLLLRPARVALRLVPAVGSERREVVALSATAAATRWRWILKQVAERRERRA